MHIERYLEKFKHVGEKEVFAREAIAQLLSARYHRPFTKDDITIKGVTLSVKAPSAIKNDLFIKKEAILAEVASQFPKLTLKELR